MHAVSAVIEVAAQKQIVGQYRSKTAGHSARRLQDVVLAADQALRLGLAEQGRAVFQGQGHGAAVEGSLAARDDTIAAGVRQLHRIGGTGLEAHIPGHVQGADGIARRNHTAAVGLQCADAPGTAQGPAMVDRDRRGQRTIDLQYTAIDRGRAAIGAVATEQQTTGAGLDQAALVNALGRRRIPGHAHRVVGLLLLAGAGARTIFPALVLHGLLPCQVFGAVFRLALQQRLVGNAIAPHIALPGRQIDVHGAQ